MAINKYERGGIALARAVRELYQDGQTDYSLDPVVLTDHQNNPVGLIQDGDTVIFCCRRGEREIQLTDAFTDRQFAHFERADFKNLTFIILTLYHEKFKDLPIAFAPTQINNTLGEVVSRANLKQLRVAESEKFAHVTFFLNGGNNQPFPGEDDLRLLSPKGIPFNQVPELSLASVADEVVTGIKKEYDLIVTNFANGDVIGHTSDNDAKVKCAEFVDKHLERVVNEATQAGYVVFITADHGNLELMSNPDGTPHVAHTSNLVPFIAIDPAAASAPQPNNGQLADLAPSVLGALNIPKPAEMTGNNLLPNHHWGGKRRVLLIILDGWGIGADNPTNPIFLAQTPTWDRLVKTYPYSVLKASGDAVGLQSNKPGNSEAGHINIGAGRVILQDDVRLDAAMKDGSFYQNDVFLNAIKKVKQSNTNLHLIGLLTEKSSHGSIDYPLALLQMAKEQDLSENTFLHVIFDGRSTEPGSAPAMLEKLEGQVESIGIGQIVSGIGRGLALDRDGNYGKTKKTYDAFVFGIGKKTNV